LGNPGAANAGAASASAEPLAQTKRQNGQSVGPGLRERGKLELAGGTSHNRVNRASYSRAKWRTTALQGATSVAAATLQLASNRHPTLQAARLAADTLSQLVQ